MTEDVQLFGGSIRKVNDAVPAKRSAVIDACHDGFAVAEIGDAHITGDRQRPVGGRQFKHVVRFAAGGSAAMKLLAIPRGMAGLREGSVDFRHGCHGFTIDDIRLGGAFDNRLQLRRHRGFERNIRVYAIGRIAATFRLGVYVNDFGSTAR